MRPKGAAGNRLTTTDPEGNIITFVYDAATQAQPTEVTVDPDSIVTGDELTTTTQYDFATGLVLSITDPNGNVATTSYTNHLLSAVDPFGRPGTVTDPQGRKTETRYHDNLRQVEVWSDLASPSDLKLRARTLHDQLGRVVKTESSENGSTYTIFSDTQYQQAGRIVITTNPLRAAAASTDGWTRTTKDDLGRVILVETFSGRPPSGTSTGVVTTSYDANVTTVADQAGKTRRSIVDGAGRLIRVDEPDNTGDLGPIDDPKQKTTYGYDALGNLTQVQQGTQPARTFIYDALSRLKQASNPESDTISYTYDDNGNLLTRTDARGVVTTFTYDGLNRVLTRTYSGPAPGGTTPGVTYAYDDSTVSNSKGRLTSVTSSASRYSYGAYDVMGPVLTGVQRTDGRDYSMIYTYDLAGNMKSETYPSGRKVDTSYDAAGRMSSLTAVKERVNGVVVDVNKAYATSFSYSAHGAPTGIQLGNTRWEQTQFNSRLQPTLIGLGTSSTDTSLFKLEYGFGGASNNGNVLSQKLTIGTSLVANQQYEYDTLNRLKSVAEFINQETTSRWKQEYGYDRWGNRTSLVNTGAEDSLLPTQSTPGINQSNNRLVGYTYDAAGNVTADPAGSTFGYDGENRMISCTVGGVTSSYSYDGDGHRVKKAAIPQPK